MDIEPGSKQDGGVVNMTRAMEALSPWLNNPRRTIIQVEALVTAAAALLLLQLILGSCKRRWQSSLVKYGLQAFTTLMNPLIIYTLGIMQSSPIKNSSYPVWAGFLIMASTGTTAVRQHDFYDSFYQKFMEVSGDYIRDAFYLTMFILLLDPNTYTLKTAFELKPQHVKNKRASSQCVIFLFVVAFFTKFIESIGLVKLGYKRKRKLLSTKKKTSRTEVAERTEESADDDGVCDSHPQSMKGYKYAVCHRLPHLITIDQIWDSCGSSVDGNALKDLCLSCALFQQLVQRCYFGLPDPGTSHIKAHDFVFKKLLPSEGDFKRAFRIVEAELGFCYDFFFTKYYYTFAFMNSPVILITQPLFLLKIIFILIVGFLAVRKSLVLDTPNPIIDVKNSEVDYIITLLVLGIALIVELVQAALYLASNWAQVSLACMYVKKRWYEPNASSFGQVVDFLRRIMISGQLRNKIKQHSVIFGPKQAGAVEVSDAVKRAVARSLISTYGNTNGETTLRQKQMFDEYSWGFTDLSQLEVMLIWHIATEYCDISSPTTPSSSWPTRCRCSKHRSFTDHLFGYVLQLLPNHGRHRITRDNHRGVAVHLSRYCGYLIGSVPELLPDHAADIAELAEKVMEERTELFGGSKIYGNKMKNLRGTGEEDQPRKTFQKGVKLGKQLERMPDGDRWKVLEEFWAKMIIHCATSPYTTKQHMQHLENGGEFLTHVWALLAHAGILNLNRNKGKEGSIPSFVV